MLIMGFDGNRKPLPDIEYLSDMQDKEAGGKSPNVNKLALANLQMLALAF